MDEMTLSTALREAREAVDEERHEEAMLLARHVLREHPACVWAYRLLAEAALERGERRQAEELFLRALSIDPEDTLSWFGLATLAEGEERLEEATRWVQRAFDLEPGKPGIRDLLVRLQRRAGVAPERVDLSRAALARLLARGGLYEQAIQEYRAALEQSPKRLDLLLGLAEALWRHGRRIEAAETCQEILERLPNCLKAHLLLGEIWQRAGRENEARPLLARAQALDPLNAVAQELLGERSPLPPQDPVLPPLDMEREALGKAPEEVPLPSLELLPAPTAEEAPLPWELEGEGAPALAMGEAEAPEEARLPVQEAEAPAPEPPEEIPDWLKALEAEAAPGAAEAAEETTRPPAPPPGAEEVPIPAPEGPAAGPVEETLPTWLAEEGVEEAPVPPEEELALPPWLQGVEEEEPAPEMPTAPPLEPVTEAEPSEAEGMPDWLAELRRRAAATVEAPEEEALAEGTPGEPLGERAPEEVALEEAPEALVEEGPPVEEGVVPVEEAPEVLMEGAPERPAAEAVVEEQVEAAQVPPALALPAEVQAALERLAVRPNDHGARLLVAKAYVAQGQVSEALVHYQYLVTVDDVLAQVVEDLEALAVREPHLARVYQLLGDAFMHQGRLNEALGAYRQALQMLHRPAPPC
ncbi:MAG: tetratricopeptide repeat protein [Anaerolineae bacterium]